MTILHILILAVIQGLAELLPVSSSAHVIVAEKLMGLDPTRPEMTLLLVMLHTGTMLAVIAYFWSPWKRAFFSSAETFKRAAALLIYATLLTGLVGYPLILFIEKVVLRHVPHAQVEMIFGNLSLMTAALVFGGVLILVAGLRSRGQAGARPLGWREAAWIGAIQGLVLPFRGFSRSGGTISMGLLLGVDKARAEEFSFALAVIITRAAIAREALRVLAVRHVLVAHSGGSLGHLFLPGLLGMVFSFLAGLVALAWLSRWLERGRWHYFGIYCLVAAAVVFSLHLAGI